MSFELIDEKTNPLMGRKEAKLLVHHQGEGTPDRVTVRKLASDHFKTPIERVFVKSISTRTGGSSALCTVEIYEDRQIAEKVVPAYLKNRNLPREQRVSKTKKGEEAKPAPPTKPATEKKTAPEPTKETKLPAEKAPKAPEKGAKAQTKPETKPKA